MFGPEEGEVGSTFLPRFYLFLWGSTFISEPGSVYGKTGCGVRTGVLGPKVEEGGRRTTVVVRGVTETRKHLPSRSRDLSFRPSPHPCRDRVCGPWNPRSRDRTSGTLSLVGQEERLGDKEGHMFSHFLHEDTKKVLS